MKNKRVITLVDEEMAEALEALSKKTRVSVAEVVRRAVSEYLDRFAAGPRSISPVLLTKLIQILFGSRQAGTTLEEAADWAKDLRHRAGSDDLAIMAATIYQDYETFGIPLGDINAAIDTAREIDRVAAEREAKIVQNVKQREIRSLGAIFEGAGRVNPQEQSDAAAGGTTTPPAADLKEPPDGSHS